MKLISRPSSGPSSPTSTKFESSLTDWRINHLIQLLEDIKDKDALPKWKSPYHLYLCGVREFMTPISPSTRCPSVCSYEDEDTSDENSDTASTPTSIESDDDIIIAQVRKPKRKLSFTLCTSDDERDLIRQTTHRKRRCSSDWILADENIKNKVSEECRERNEVRNDIRKEFAEDIR